MINILYNDLLALINNNELIPSSSYRITNYTTTTVQADTTSAGHNFDVIVTALSTNELSENASVVQHDGDIYFENANLEVWEIKYCIDNDTNRFVWADSVNGKGVIYYMKDENGNECPYDFKNIQFLKNIQYLKNGIWVYTFGGTMDNSLSGGCYNNIINLYISSNKQTLNNITFGTGCYSNTFGDSCHSNTFGNNCYSNTFGDNCHSNNFGNNCYQNTFGIDCNYNTFGNYCNGNTFGTDCMNNTFGDSCHSNNFGNNCYFNTFGINCGSNTFGIDCNSNTFGADCMDNTFGADCMDNTFGDSCHSNNFGNNCYQNTFGIDCNSNTFGNDCSSNTFGDSCQSNTFDNYCQTNTFGDSGQTNTFGDYCNSNTFGNGCNNNTFGIDCSSNTFGNDCLYNNFYDGLSGTTPKNYIRYIVLEDGVSNNNFYSDVTTGVGNYLQSIRISGLENDTPTDTIITLPATNTNDEWLIGADENNDVTQFPNVDGIEDAPIDGTPYSRQDGGWVVAETGIEDAPNDNKIYGRKDGDWVVAETGIEDAPNDNKIYGRKDGDWVEIDEYEKIKTITSTTNIALDKQYKIYKYTHSSGNITSFSFSTALLSDLGTGEAYTFEMEIIMPSDGTSITFPSTIVPLNETTITLKAGKKNYLAFRTFDGINFIVNYQGFI